MLLQRGVKNNEQGMNPEEIEINDQLGQFL